MSETVFGPLVSTWAVEKAVIAVYKEWLPAYMAAVERQLGLPNKTVPRPPNSACYYGGLDFQSEIPASLPVSVVIVVVEPTGTPEMSAGGYFQDYRVRVGCIAAGQSEEEARLNASVMGAASMLLAQVSALKGLAEQTVMTGAPLLEWVDPEESQRRLIRSVVTFEVHVPNIVERFTGPAGETLATSPEFKALEPEVPPTERPVIKEEKLTVEGGH